MKKANHTAIFIHTCARYMRRMRIKISVLITRKIDRRISSVKKNPISGITGKCNNILIGIHDVVNSLVK